MGRFSAVFLFGMMLFVASAAHGALSPYARTDGVHSAASPAIQLSTPEPTPLASERQVASSGVRRGLELTARSESLPDGGIVYDSRGAWLTDAPGGRPVLLTRGPVPRQSVLLPILMYHHVRPIDFQTAGQFASELTLPPAQLEQQLRYLQERGIATVSMMDLWLYLQGRRELPPRAVVLTFDDGYADCYSYAFPILTRFGAKATFFIPTGFLGRADYMTWANLKELAAAGMEIGGHTIGHVDLTTTTGAMRDRELVQSRQDLESNLRVAVRALAYPGGAFNLDAEAAAARAGYLVAVTTRPGAVHERGKIMALPRVRISGTDTLAAFRWKIEQYFPVSAADPQKR